MLKTGNKLTGTLLLIGDLSLFYLSLYTALHIRGLSISTHFPALRLPFSHIFILWALIYFIMDFYEITSIKNLIVFIKELLVFSILASLIGFAYFYLQPRLNLTPRAVLFLTVLNFSILSSLWRWAVSLLVDAQSFRKKIIFIGFCGEVMEILDRDNFKYEVAGIYSDGTVPEKVMKKTRVVKSIEELKKISEGVDIAVFASHEKDNKDTIRRIFETLPLSINYMDFVNLYEEVTGKVPLYSIDDWWFLENVSRPANKLNDILTRTFELAVSLAGLALTGLAFPFLAALIKADSRGTVLYRQKRLGRFEKPFTMYKFRTMANDAEKNGPQWSAPGDRRITRAGKVLRKLHLDELPQFYNIARGDISFVGPRPERPYFVEKLKKEIPYYDVRHLEKPGLTGWAQLCFPASSTVEEAKEKFKYELYYIKNRSFLFDMVIILKSIRTVFRLKKNR